MKNILKSKYVLMPLLGLTILSCAESEITLEDPNNTGSDELADFSSLLIGMYDEYQKIPVNEFILTEMRSDNTSSKSGDGSFGVIDNYTYDQNLGEGLNYWANNYTVIRHANNVIQFADELDNHSLGQGYFMRALAHFNLVKNYQNIQYVTSYVNTAAELSVFPQLPPEETYAHIIEDLELAVSLLDITPSSENVFASKGAAKGILAKAYMSKPLVTSGDYAKAQAVLADMVVDGNAYGYELLDSANYGDIFGVSSDNSEVVFAIQYDAGTAVTSDYTEHEEGEAQGWSIQMAREGPAQGLNVASTSLIAAFEADDADVADPLNPPIRSFYNMFETELRFYNNKFRDNLIAVSDVNWVVLRYADILLLYTEAVLAGGNITTDALAIECFNKVRARAQVSLATADVTKEQLLNERRLELAYENHRLDDLIRFGVAGSTLEAYSNENDYEFDLTDLYLAIPQREIQILPEVYTQNLGY